MYAEYIDTYSKKIVVRRENDDATIEGIIGALVNSIDFIVYDMSDLQYFGNDCAGYDLTIEDDCYIVNSQDVAMLGYYGYVVLDPQE